DDRAESRRQVVLVAIRLATDDFDNAAVFGALQLDHTIELGQDRLALRHPSFEQLRDARQTRGDVDTCDTARVECAHRELRARLTDRLGGNDTDRVADADQAARAHMPAVAVLTDAVACLTRERRAQ